MIRPIFRVGVPLTIIKSDCRGLGLKTPAPNRSMSKRDAPVAIISIAQQARPNVIGQSADFRDQLQTKSTVVVMMPLDDSTISSLSFAIESFLSQSAIRNSQFFPSPFNSQFAIRNCSPSPFNSQFEIRNFSYAHSSAPLRH